jgi:hypothetical protein
VVESEQRRSDGDGHPRFALVLADNMKRRKSPDDELDPVEQIITCVTQRRREQRYPEWRNRESDDMAAPVKFDAPWCPLVI